MSKVEDSVVKGYQKIEDTAVKGYKKVEDSVVGGYKKIEDKFVDKFLRKDDETIEEAKARITKEQHNIEDKNRQVVEEELKKENDLINKDFMN